MTSDEAEAAAWLEKRFWKNVFSSQYEFLWRPRWNAETNRVMWLCKAVRVQSSYVEHLGSGAEYEHIQTRWYTPKDFVMKRLSS